jgi:hypothetical protein
MAKARHVSGIDERTIKPPGATLEHAGVRTSTRHDEIRALAFEDAVGTQSDAGRGTSRGTGVQTQVSRMERGSDQGECHAKL